MTEGYINNDKKTEMQNKFKLAIKLFIIIGIFTAVLTTISYKYFKNYNLYNTVEHNTQLVKQVSSSIDDYLEDIKKDMKVLGESKQIESIIESEDNKAVENLLERFQNYGEFHEEVINIYLGTPNKNLYVYPHTEIPDAYDPTARQWYADTVNTKDYFWSKPYVDSAAGKIIVTLSMPVYSEEKIVGVLGIDIDLEAIGKKIEDFPLGETGYMTLIDKEGNIVVHPCKELIGEPLPIDELKEVLDRNHDMGSILYSWDGTEKNAFYSKINNGNFNLVGIVSENELLQGSERFLYAVILMGVLNALIITIFCLLISVCYGKKQKGNIVKKQLEKENYNKSNDLKDKLDRLNEYKLNGTLTKEEYESKRADIIRNYEI